MKGPLNNQIISLIPILLATIISSPELQWSRSSPALVDALPIRSDTVVTDLLTDLFRQTIYTRIENLLLDPGRKSQEKQKIIDSAVDNYHKQKMIMPEDQEAPSTLADLTGKLQKCDILEVAFNDEFELKFLELSRAKMKIFQAESSRAGHFNF